MARIAAYMIFASFLSGSFVAVLDARQIQWMYFVPCVLLGIAGVVAHRRARSSHARSDDRVRANLQLMADCLQRIHTELAKLCSHELPTHEYRYEIDRRFRNDLMSFAEARESMIHHFGIDGYAEVMSGFAAGERYINRIWSASCDGYVDEVRMYLTKARDQFEEAQTNFVRHRTGSAAAAG